MASRNNNEVSRPRTQTKSTKPCGYLEIINYVASALSFRMSDARNCWLIGYDVAGTRYKPIFMA